MRVRNITNRPSKRVLKVLNSWEFHLWKPIALLEIVTADYLSPKTYLTCENQNFFSHKIRILKILGDWPKASTRNSCRSLLSPWIYFNFKRNQAWTIINSYLKFLPNTLLIITETPTSWMIRSKIWSTNWREKNPNYMYFIMCKLWYLRVLYKNCN